MDRDKPAAESGRLTVPAFVTQAVYGYADNNPLNEADPTGLCSCYYV